MDSSYAMIPRHTNTEEKGKNDVQIGTRKNGILEKVFKDKLEHREPLRMKASI